MKTYRGEKQAPSILDFIIGYSKLSLSRSGYFTQRKDLLIITGRVINWPKIRPGCGGGRMIQCLYRGLNSGLPYRTLVTTPTGLP
jgi:hypothetical protein